MALPPTKLPITDLCCGSLPLLHVLFLQLAKWNVKNNLCSKNQSAVRQHILSRPTHWTHIWTPRFCVYMPHCISSWKDENKSLPTLPSSSFAFSACEECLNETAGLCKSNQQNLHNVDMVCMRNFRLLLAWQQKDRYQVFFFCTAWHILNYSIWEWASQLSTGD